MLIHLSTKPVPGSRRHTNFDVRRESILSKIRSTANKISMLATLAGNDRSGGMCLSRMSTPHIIQKREITTAGTWHQSVNNPFLVHFMRLI